MRFKMTIYFSRKFLCLFFCLGIGSIKNQFESLKLLIRSWPWFLWSVPLLVHLHPGKCFGILAHFWEGLQLPSPLCFLSCSPIDCQNKCSTNPHPHLKYLQGFCASLVLCALFFHFLLPGNSFFCHIFNASKKI